MAAFVTYDSFLCRANRAGRASRNDRDNREMPQQDHKVRGICPCKNEEPRRLIDAGVRDSSSSKLPASVADPQIPAGRGVTLFPMAGADFDALGAGLIMSRRQQLLPLDLAVSTFADQHLPLDVFPVPVAYQHAPLDLVVVAGTHKHATAFQVRTAAVVNRH